MKIDLTVSEAQTLIKVIQDVLDSKYMTKEQDTKLMSIKNHIVNSWNDK